MSSPPSPPRVFVLLSLASVSVTHTKRKRTQKYSEPALEQTQLSLGGMEASAIRHSLVTGTSHSLFHVTPVRRGLLPAPR